MSATTADPRPLLTARLLALALWLWIGGASLQAGERPQRVVSVNLCTDQLLLMLADPGQVASVSHLAVEPLSSFVAAQARDYPLNHARAEEVIALEPDLVLDSHLGNPRLRTTLAALGYRVEPLASAHSLPQIIANIRQLARLLGQQARGEAMIQAMQDALDAPAGPPPAERPGALFLQPRGYTSGVGTLQDEALRLAGWRNLSAEHGVTGYSPVPLERLLSWRPDRLFTSPYDGSGDSLAQRSLRHPALNGLLRERPPVEIPYKYWICPGPMLSEAVALLRQARTEPGSEAAP